MPGHCKNNSNEPDALERPSRRWLFSSFGLGAIAGSQFTVRSLWAASGENMIVQPNVPNGQAFMRRAFEMRRLAIEKGDQAYGAVVVRDGRIIGQSWSRVLLDSDPTGHAEMSAIRDACRRLGDRDLSGATLYSSSRACPMCEAASYWAGIEDMVYGSNHSAAGPPRLCR
jgi:tRNA(Arg) A34 adenosine deaminase TadA